MDRRAIEKAIADEIATSREVRDEINDLAEDVADTWRDDLAPVESGTYRDSISVERKATGRLDLKGRTPAATIAADDEAASYIEYGTKDTPTHAPARRTAARYIT